MITFYPKYDYEPTAAKEQITMERHRIPTTAPYFIHLRHIPKQDSPSTVIIPGLVETDGIPGPGQFRVHYGETGAGRIDFNEAEAGLEITVDYIACGTIIIAETYPDGREGINKIQNALIEAYSLIGDLQNDIFVLQNKIQQLEKNTYQIGDFKFTAYADESDAGEDFMLCDGRELVRAEHPILFARLGTRWGAGDGVTTFNIPEGRGEFLRVADYGRGVDPDREVGSWQADEIKAHSHQYSLRTGTVTTGLGGSSGTSSSSTTGTTQETGGPETRPRNIAVGFFVKYK